MNINEKVKLDFCTPVFFEKKELQKLRPLTQFFIRVGQAADSYLSFSKVKINASTLKEINSEFSLWKTALKIASYLFTGGILPLFALISKLIYRNYCENSINEKRQKTLPQQGVGQEQVSLNTLKEEVQLSLNTLKEEAQQIPTMKIESTDDSINVSEVINQQIADILSQIEKPQTSNQERLKGYLEIERLLGNKVELNASNASRIEALKQEKVMVPEQELRDKRPEAVVITKKRGHKPIPLEWRTTLTKLIAKTSRLPGSNVGELSTEDKKIIQDASDVYPPKLDDLPNRKPIESRTESNRVLIPLAFDTKQEGFAPLTKGAFDKSKAVATTPQEEPTAVEPESSAFGTFVVRDEDAVYATTVVREADVTVEDADANYGTFVAHT